MADVVHFRLERMANELDDLERRGLLERDKISEIVKQRREFEYRLQRPSPLKQDFLAYIEYEKKLEAYRKLRKRMIVRQMQEEADEEEGEKKKRRKKWKKSFSDYAGVLRILDLYRMAVMRYKGDLGLWFQYLEFCKERRHGRMKEALGQALKLHPKVSGLWIYAAAWEFDKKLNVVAARALMQSGLRACPKSEDMWIEYLRLELTYLNKLKARKEALGEDLQTLERGGILVRQWKEDNKDLFMSLDAGNDEKNDKKESDLEENHAEKQNLFWQLGFMVLEAIYHEAIKTIPSSISLRKRFLEVLSSIDLAHSNELKIEILKDLKRDFSHDEQYWDLMARIQLSDVIMTNEEDKHEVSSKLNQAFQVYEEALNVLPSVKMFFFFVKFWSDVTCPESMMRKVGLDVSEFSLFLKKAYEKAESTGCLIEDLACLYISFYLQDANLEKARKMAEKLCSGKLSEAAAVWLLRISIEINCLADKTSSMSKDDLDHIFQLLECVLNRLPLSKAEGLWFLALKVFSCHKAYFKRLVKILEAALARCSSSCEFSVPAAVVDRTLQRDGILHARVLYNRFLALPHPGLAFFKHCIEFEKNLASFGDDTALQNARKLYESALQIYREDRNLWKDYYSMEMKMGTSATANAAYWRARKELKDTTGFCPPS
ncbi:U3 small nucleolar RNA-associated protein 6 homolog [Phalaenopsis equestris]|uniref:U3 small nucleolar RNA-associated protein 6 homolog n=1 Tax=Phalaenopsis equestris TaxID=78828 RepID=UPI0009E5AAA2|nr:U3 small nucleolar RNA-associated protein 6 homolog [Phalaenopsis equestris]XP_020590804.1 U3 small nucleolar RNA-associated protein 6 homolog [Phalaenopsis equestris]